MIKTLQCQAGHLVFILLFKQHYNPKLPKLRYREAGIVLTFPEVDESGILHPMLLKLGLEQNYYE
jgi:hypothetical protein